MALADFVNNVPRLGKATPLSAFTETRDAIIAVALVKNEDLALEWDALYAWPTGYIKIGTAVAATGSEAATGKNIVDIIRSLALRSKAWVFPHGTIKGSKGMPTPTKAAETFSVLPIPRDTGTVTELAELRVSGMHLYQDFWNSLRVKSLGYQTFLFLNNMVIWVRPEHSPMWHDIGVAIGGDTANAISGGAAQLTWQSIGEVVWKGQVPFASLSENYFQFQFDVVTPTTLALGTCTSGNVKLNGTVAGGGSFTRPILEAAFSDCVVYTLEILSGPGSTGITINASTGAVTVATGLTAGTYNIRVLAQNNTSVFGFYDASITLV